MATTATATIARPAGNGILVALLKTAIDFLGRAEDRRTVARAAEVIEAPRSNDVDLWKLYWTTAGSGANSPKVRQLLERGDQ